VASIHADQQTQARNVFDDICQRKGLVLPEGYFDILYQTAEWLALQTEKKQRITFGVSGSQGSGKSTFSMLLENILKATFSTPAIVLSLDDFYLTHSERITLSELSPMLKTRGVPGTHDLALAMSAKDQFLHGDLMRIPEFSKSEDDRVGYSDVSANEFTLLIFEGWCWGAKPVPKDSLNPPKNDLEREADPKGIWRQYVNERLFDYQSLFATDFSLFLKVPDFACVARWRWQQEQGLPDGPGRMTKAEVERFIMYYERITQQLLRDFGSEANICLALGQDHSIQLEKFPAPFSAL
jgi:D-glycerate 3-kinase